MASESEVGRLREAGNSFVFRGALVLLLVHFLVFPALTGDKRAANQVIGNQLRRLSDQRQLLEGDLKTIENTLKSLSRKEGREPNHSPESNGIGQAGESKHKNVQFPIRSKLSLDSDPTYLYRLNKMDSLKAQRYVQASLEKNAEQTVALAKAKYSKELKIPGTDTIVDESELRIFYAIGLALMVLILVFRYRNPLLRKFDSSSEEQVPLWSAPLPYGRHS